MAELLFQAEKYIKEQRLEVDGKIVAPFVGNGELRTLVVLQCPTPNITNYHSASPCRTISMIKNLNGGTLDGLVVCDAFPYKRSSLNNDGSKGRNITVSILDIDFAKWWISSLISHFGMSRPFLVFSFF